MDVANQLASSPKAGRTASAAYRAYLPQLLIGRVQQPRAAAGQLDFHLLPAGQGGGVAHRLRRDIVGHHLGQGIPRVVEQDPAAAHGGDTGHRPQRLAARDGAHEPGKLPGHLPRGRAERQVDLAARVAAQRQLQVPPGIAAALAAPQRDAGADQAQVVGVVILRLQRLLVRARLGSDLRQIAEIRQLRSRRHIVLPLGFPDFGSHKFQLPAAAGVILPPMSSSSRSLALARL